MQNSAVRRGLYAAAFAIALPTLYAQQPASRPGEAKSAQGQQQQQQKPPQQQPPAKPDQVVDQKPTFRTRIELVTTDVIVRDNKGQFVPDLTQHDFEVFEDGVKQDIVSMELIHGGRVNPILSAAPPAQ